MKKTAVLCAALVTVMLETLALPVFAGEPTAAERVIAVKAHLAESQTVLRQYQWVETTSVSVKGVEKSRTQKVCSYDADGVVRKVPVNPQDLSRRDNLARQLDNAEMNKEGITVDMESAKRLVHTYIPLNPNGLQEVVDKGKLSFNETDPGKQGRLTIRDFLKRGDQVDLDLEMSSNRPLSLNINSYFDDAKNERVTLAVTFGSLYGRATFAREIVLNAAEKKLNVTVRNTDYNTLAP
ncbi:MAG: hypothetical protein ED859_10795 [Desulfuromonadales bacterium]|nr:MAG: hypothetical protein ED859_10795 [Desulfuromonadales bacterium]